MKKEDKFKPGLKAVVSHMFDNKQMTTQISSDVDPKRTVYYSSILAFSSAALVFLGQYAQNDKNGSEVIFISISILCFSLSLVTLIFLYFSQVVHATQWGKAIGVFGRIEKIKPLEDPMQVMDHEYFKDKNKENEKASFKMSLYISARMFDISNILDIVLFISVLLAIISYSVSIMINLLQ